MLRNIARRAMPFHAHARKMQRSLIDSYSPFESPRVDLGCGDDIHDGFIGVDLDKETRPHIVADASEMPIKSGAIGTAVINSVLEHVQYPSGVVKEISRILKCGGIVLATIPTDLGSRIKPLTRAIWKQRNNLSKIEWEKEFSDAGFKLVHSSMYYPKQLFFVYLFSCVFPVGILIFPIARLLEKIDNGRHIFIVCKRL